MTTSREEDQEHKAEDSGLIPAHRAMPERIYLLPMGNRPFFPGQVQPVMINPDPWEQTLERVAQTPHHLVGLCFIDQKPSEQAQPEDFPATGTVVRIHRASKEDGRIQFIAQGVRRFRITNWLRRKPPYLVQVAWPEAEEPVTDEIRAYAMALIGAIKELLAANPLYGEEVRNYLSHFGPNDPSPLTDFAAAITASATGAELQHVLETVPLLPRMEKVLPLVRKEVEVAKLHQSINEQVNEKISERQREFFLREQLKVIKRELGISKDDKTAEADEFRTRLEGKQVPPAARKRIDEELRKFAVLEQGSPEYGVTRNYLDWLTALPWGITSPDNLDLAHARRVLDEHHAGLADVKDRILEFLAVGAWKKEIAGSILLLVGPPGVGKTSIGKSIADALGRKFYRFSVGGMRDEAEIKGHRRTYIGALPGKLLQALKDVEVSNPVILLDEIDKLSASYHGDPASALLEVLDPEQNREFLDHYLDVRVDLSRVLFICTANQLDTIPPPLLDRMDVIRLAGYLTDEKLAIARDHLWPRQLERAGVPRSRITLNDAALRAIIEGYAREAGVRQLEKLLSRIVRKVVVRLLADPKLRVRIGARDLNDYLGAPVFRPEKTIRGVGVVTGLAWTAMGGATLPVEATRIHTKNRGFKLTGKLGEVMKESAEIAYSYVSSHSAEYGGDPDFFDDAFVHLHVPEGATPKDGPSAGITMATALLSLTRNEAIRRPLAMTGELTLTGQVLPVGGIREKLVAARRQKITEIILPEANQRDYDELPASVREGLDVHFAGHFREVAALVFG